MKDVQFWICFQTEGSLTEPLTEGYIAVSYSCPLKGQPATPLDFFYRTFTPTGAFQVLLDTSRLLATISHSVVTPQVFQASFFIISTVRGER